MTIKLSNHSVRLISLSKPIASELLDASAEDLLVYIARVSNPQNQSNFDTGAKLLKYLYTQKHWSPFEMLSATVEINTTRDIARQILRHRSFSFQEFSQRYADATTELGFTLREVRLQDDKNRQNSIEVNDEELQAYWDELQTKVINLAEHAYKWAISNKIAKEQARSVLPEGNTKSRIYMAGTIRSWVHYLGVRKDKSTQKEHREIADDIAKLFNDQFPSLAELLED